jgi:hypothetical protein
MKKQLWSAVLILAICCGCVGRPRPAADTAAGAADAGTPYTRIPGTRLSMLVPPDFRISPYGIGQLVDERGDQIVIMDILDGNYYENAKNYTLENLGKQTSAPISFQQMEIEGYEAAFARIKSTAFMPGNMMLIFGDSTFCVSAVVIHGPGDSDDRQEILKNALLSVRYDPQLPVDPTEFAPFAVAENASGFEFDDYSMGMFSYRNRDRQKIMTISFAMLPGVTVDKLIEEQKRQLDFQYTGDTALSLIDEQQVHEHLMVGDRSDEGVQLVYVALVADAGLRQSVAVLFPYFSDSGRPTLEDEEVGAARVFARAIKLDANELTE